ncbi:MAG: hypothetical protein Kow00109_09470 [Acidobacteriota bacterium]
MGWPSLPNRLRLRVAVSPAGWPECTPNAILTKPHTDSCRYSLWRRASRKLTNIEMMARKRTATGYGCCGLRNTAEGGFTLVELMLVVALIGILGTLAVSSYQESLEAARIARTIGDIKALEKDILLFELRHGRLPDSLSELPREELADPWGNPYQYLNFQGVYRRGDAGGGASGGGERGHQGEAGSPPRTGHGESGVPRNIYGLMRKDRNMVPINSRFDLYSMGRDGQSVPPITAQQSQDDIIRANDGGFVGLARNY